MIRLGIVLLLVLLAVFVVWRVTRETPAQKSARLLREQEAKLALESRQQDHWDRVARQVPPERVLPYTERDFDR